MERKKNITEIRNQLLSWYKENYRPLPWRVSRDPYRIWISEIMLQQTTTTAVIPFFQRFLAKFPTVTALANAPLEDVLQAWSGLGYYSRARNLHKCAHKLANISFPKKYSELIELPGLGPYTSRAISSQAFNEQVGVVDGNVIRVLSRLFAVDLDWWQSANRSIFQNLADELAQTKQVSDLNQSLMELGATVCTPRSPTCFICPVRKSCEAFRLKKQNEWPRPKPRKKNEIWQWNVFLYKKNNKYFLTKDHQSPFLKKDWLPPGDFKKIEKKPKQYHVRHSITHHDIFVQITSVKSLDSAGLKKTQGQWLKETEIAKLNPSSLIKKIFIEANQMNND